jgi:hypothetical protein
MRPRHWRAYFACFWDWAGLSLLLATGVVTVLTGERRSEH